MQKRIKMTIIFAVISFLYSILLIGAMVYLHLPRYLLFLCSVLGIITIAGILRSDFVDMQGNETNHGRRRSTDWYSLIQSETVKRAEDNREDMIAEYYLTDDEITKKENKRIVMVTLAQPITNQEPKMEPKQEMEPAAPVAAKPIVSPKPKKKDTSMERIRQARKKRERQNAKNERVRQQVSEEMQRLMNLQKNKEQLRSMMAKAESLQQRGAFIMAISLYRECVKISPEEQKDQYKKLLEQCLQMAGRQKDGQA
ncbi:MAG: hypothetical protein PHW34_01965 [Hespellia sp.]|nr:hypothetical protein [Hespellia sp.]